MEEGFGHGAMVAPKLGKKEAILIWFCLFSWRKGKTSPSKRLWGETKIMRLHMKVLNKWWLWLALPHNYSLVPEWDTGHQSWFSFRVQVSLKVSLNVWLGLWWASWGRNKPLQAWNQSESILSGYSWRRVCARSDQPALRWPTTSLSAQNKVGVSTLFFFFKCRE